MRLSSIKLSGFKSFVDPTTLHLSTDLTGIVGPNGCGKSNIIDAIRWVMGESAASRLRGDAITDVIFAGSGNRKPVGSATVELVFDNSDGLIAGEYAKFNEISVKRTVSRDGQSSYFLNGGRCRRRDIVDVFLGTGLGARSYSIIEQGMISQIVEARPEDLRLHLEEAAGISKYKERRKETETRIRATRENLERLNDVRQEVDKNLDHLNRQARNAERWQKLKAEAARVEAELRALSLKAEDEAVAASAAAVSATQVEIDRVTADQREVEARIEAFRDRQVAASDAFNKVQGEVYRVGAEIARVEQQIQHNRDLSERLARAGRETEQQLAEIAEHARADREQIALLTSALADVGPRHAELEAVSVAKAESLRAAEQAIAEWQQRWDRYAKASGEAARRAEVERTRLDFVDRQSNDLGRRREQLQREQEQADLAKLGSDSELLETEQATQKARLDELSTQAEQRKARYAELGEELKQAQGELSRLRQAFESAKGRAASLEALQHAALGQDIGPVREWLASVGVGEDRRVGELLDVDAGWEPAVEAVLADWLKAVVAEDPHALATEVSRAGAVDLALVGPGTGSGAPGTLAAKVRGPRAIVGLLSKVRVAGTLDQAREIARRLGPDESVVTAEGEWFGADWFRVARRSDARSGVIAREREIHGLGEERARLEAAIEAAASRIESLKSSIGEAELARDEAQRELYLAHRRLSELAGQMQSQKGRLEAAQQRARQIESELADLATRLADNETQAKESRARLDAAVAEMGELEAERRTLDADRRALLERREEARIEAREAQDEAHRFALQSESKRAALASLEQALARMLAQQQTLEARAKDLGEQLAAGSQPQEALEAERRTYLDQRLLVDRELVEARKALDALDGEMREVEVARHRVEQQLAGLRETHGNQRLAEQAARLRAEQFRAQITEAGFEAEAIIAELDPAANAEAWQQRLSDLEAKIRRLEPVNLAAIQEHAEQSERKVYLDAQHGDLTQALETLEGAIRKIDRETRTRFKETFDKVNQGMGELFPRLFGGGHAYLELTSDDLLETGVTIMARPPGKRVSNISLLSGGEKALTAVSLVFAIFRLNPAPFCLLDEVDAPLDEANVGRFCAMVAEMSERVQFIVVTHNKVTMENMRQLCGVTMREAGVSRLVQVDLEEAAKLAGAA
jgi:chromosome segregation protein